jgi:methyl-accepting chemotaxis protein
MNFLKYITIKTKLIFIIVLMMGSMVSLSVSNIDEKTELYRGGKLEKLKSIVDVAYTRLDDLHTKMNTRGLSEEYVRELFYAELQAMWYDNGEGYIFLYDSKGINIKQPTDNSLEGKSEWNDIDINGKYIVREMIDVAVNQGQGYVSYNYQKPPSNEVVEKVAYIKYFKPFDLIIGTGIYMDDVAKKEAEITQKVLVELSMLGLLVLVLFIMIFVDFNNALRKLKTDMTSLADNDTSVEIDLSRKDEIGEMAQSVEVFKANAIARRELEEQAEAEKARIEAESQEKLNEITVDVALSSSLVEEHITGISTAASELSSTLEDIGSKIDETSNMTMLAQDEAQKGNTTIQELNESAVKIGEVVKLIQEIAEKTNLLALNASIEAARAGEDGRGFAVVAEEVKKLAQQTSNATSDIYSQVNMIQLNSKNSVSAIENIGQQINSINEFTQMLVVSMNEQRTATNDISERMAQASDGARAVSARIQEIRS